MSPSFGMPNRLARRDIGLRRDRRGVDDQHIVLPLADRPCNVRSGSSGGPTAVGVNPPHAVAVDLAQPGDAARRSGEVNHSISQPATYCFNSLLSCSLSRGGAQFFTPPPRTPPIVGAPWNYRLA